MRKIVAGLFVSLDGVIESPEKWHFPYFNDEMEAIVTGQMADADTMLMGRVTYQEFAGFWPQQDSSDPFAAHMNNTPKLVASRTLDQVEWQNARLLKGDVASELTELKQGSGKAISVVGSAGLVRSLLQDDVLDELSLLIHPIVVGSGKRLFTPDDPQQGLKLTHAQTLSTGVLHAVYGPE